MLPHRLGTARRQLHVVRMGPARVGVTFDADRHGGPRLEHARDLVEQREAARLDGDLVGVEEDLLFELDLLLGHDDVLELLGAAAVVGRPGLVRALVGHVEHAVLVVVRIGATVGVLEPVLVLRLVRALVGLVGDAVGVVVGIRAAVGVLEPVLVLRLVGALVGHVRDAVFVVIGIRAAVGVFEPVLVLWLVRAFVDVVEDAVVITVARGGRRVALVARRHAIGLAGVAVGHLHVVARPEVVALIQLALGELDVGLRQRQLTRRALVGAVVAGLLGDAAHLVDVGLELGPRAPPHAERGQEHHTAHDGGRKNLAHHSLPGVVGLPAAAGSGLGAAGSSFWFLG